MGLGSERAKMRYLMLLTSIGLLAGCALDPKQREARENAHLQELARVCEKVGYESGSTANKDCVVKLLAAEIAQPIIVNHSFPLSPTLCHSVGKNVICNAY